MQKIREDISVTIGACDFERLRATVVDDDGEIREIEVGTRREWRRDQRIGEGWVIVNGELIYDVDYNFVDKQSEKSIVELNRQIFREVCDGTWDRR